MMRTYPLLLLATLFVLPAWAQETKPPAEIQPRVQTSPKAQTQSETQAEPKADTKPKADAKSKTLDKLELDRTAITGNRELPKVLYIVPWKKSDLGDLTGRPTNSLLDEVLAPVDREVFQRQTQYYDKLNKKSE